MAQVALEFISIFGQNTVIEVRVASFEIAISQQVFPLIQNYALLSRNHFSSFTIAITIRNKLFRCTDIYLAVSQFVRFAPDDQVHQDDVHAR
jgi:hypothetical protein